MNSTYKKKYVTTSPTSAPKVYGIRIIGNVENTAPTHVLNLLSVPPSSTEKQIPEKIINPQGTKSRQVSLKPCVPRTCRYAATMNAIGTRSARSITMKSDSESDCRSLIPFGEAASALVSFCGPRPFYA